MTMMLTKFAVKNYRGFEQRIEWDLSHPSNYEFNPFAIKEGIVKNGIIYGPNGSGKTNLGLAVFDIVNHLSQKWKKPDYYMNFVYAGKPDSPVEFEYTFKFNDQLIEYNYSKNSIGVLTSESLSVDGRMVFSRRDDAFDIDDKQFPMEDTTRKNLMVNANRVSIVNFLLTSYPLAEDNCLIALHNFANSMLWFKHLDTREFIGLEANITLIDTFIIQNNLVDDFADFINKVSEQSFRFVTHNVNDKVLLCEIGGAVVVFNQIASTGTQSLMLLYFWIKKMVDRASFVFIDEFDAFYHFKLAFEVCRQLFSLDCQVFTSSHNTYLMTNDLLRPDCNFIISDNKIKPLNECTDKELRFGHNIEKLFRGDAFQV